MIHGVSRAQEVEVEKRNDEDQKEREKKIQQWQRRA